MNPVLYGENQYGWVLFEEAVLDACGIDMDVLRSAQSTKSTARERTLRISKVRNRTLRISKVRNRTLRRFEGRTLRRQTLSTL
eukprot:COSAG02_NODE_2651_length_8325_cov_5.663506_3_plen_83_part_00